MTQAQGKHEATEFMIGGFQIGTPIANQKWVDDFLASRRQGLSERTLEFYRDILYQFVGIDLTAKGINDWLTNLNCGNAKFSYYRAVKVFCNWLLKSKRIAKNPIALVDKPKTSKRLLPAVSAKQFETLISSTDNFRDKCILKLLFDSGCRLGEVEGIKDTDFDWDKDRVSVIGKGNKQRIAPFTKDTGKMLKQWFSQHKTFELKKWGVQTMLKRLEQKTGISCSAHSFRRGFVIHQLKKRFINQGCPVVRRLGSIQSNYRKMMLWSYTLSDSLKLYSDIVC